jgi:hypothetical protein
LPECKLCCAVHVMVAAAAAAAAAAGAAAWDRTGMLTRAASAVKQHHGSRCQHEKRMRNSRE